MDALKEVIEIIAAGACDVEEAIDPTKETTSAELEHGKCADGQPHKVWLGMTGDTWPVFCSKCKRYATETTAWPYEDDNW